MTMNVVSVSGIRSQESISRTLFLTLYQRNGSIRRRGERRTE
jgi:hypothetical protein